MLDIYRLLVTFFLGVTEGLTEFLPVSSMGHMILIHSVLNNACDVDYILIIFTQLGAILSVILIFWKRLYYMSTVCVVNLFIKKCCRCDYFCFLHVLVGTLPGIVFGVLFFEKFSLILDSVHVMYGLMIGAVFLLVADRYSLKVRIFYTDKMTYFQAFLIGCFQCLAFFPGFSRSGATIGGGLFVGLNRRISLEFSFFLAIPIMCGAAILAIYRCNSAIFIADSLFLCIGCITAFCCSILTVRFFLTIIQKISFFPFVIYRFMLAGSIYWVLFK